MEIINVELGQTKNMLGTLKPKRHVSDESAKIYRFAHCSVCKNLQKRSMIAPLSLSREATWLVLFGVAYLDEELETTSERCSALPLIKRTTLSAPDWLLELASAFSIIAGKTALDDHEKDQEHLVKRLIISPTVTPHLDWALDILPLKHELIQDMSEPRVSSNDTLDSYLQSHHDSIAQVWREALFKSTNSKQTKQSLMSLSRALCDLMLLNDAIEDLEDDLKRGALNPLTYLHHSPDHMRAMGAQRLGERVRVVRSQLFALTSHAKTQTSLAARQALLDALPTPLPQYTPNTLELT